MCVIMAVTYSFRIQNYSIRGFILERNFTSILKVLKASVKILILSIRYFTVERTLGMLQM